MNNKTHFKREFMLTVERIGAPKTVYVADSAGYRFPVPVPIYGGVSISEQEFVDKIIKEKGVGTIPPLIVTIANKIAPLNGGDATKVAAALIKYQRNELNALDEYEGYLLIHAKDEFDQFVAGVEGPRLKKWGYAAESHALLNRVPDMETRHGRKWKTEDALDPKIMTDGVLLEFNNLFQLEAMGADLTPYINDRQEFTWNRKAGTQETKKEEEAEVLAGK
jgi:hypothetical protein